jgi:succinyl-CoA synthetase beta subunit
MTPELLTGWINGLSVPSFPDEHETKRLFAAAGIDVPAGLRVDANTADEHLDALLSEGSILPPYVVKVCSAEVLHKTEAGGVMLGVGAGALRATLQLMSGRFPGRKLLVERQLRFEPTEIIIGGLLDANLGPALMAGAGGILAELYRDVAFRLAPCSEREALRMLGELRLFPVLQGFRGMKLEASSLAAVISRVGDLIVSLGDRFEQLDINPIVFADGHWTALDAKLILRA